MLHDSFNCVVTMNNFCFHFCSFQSNYFNLLLGCIPISILLISTDTKSTLLLLDYHLYNPNKLTMFWCIAFNLEHLSFISLLLYFLTIFLYLINWLTLHTCSDKKIDSINYWITDHLSRGLLRELQTYSSQRKDLTVKNYT